MKKLMTMVATVAFVAVFALNVQVSFDPTGKTSDVTTQDLQVQKVLAGELRCGCIGSDCSDGWGPGTGCCTERRGFNGNNYRCY